MPNCPIKETFKNALSSSQKTAMAISDHGLQGLAGGA